MPGLLARFRSLDSLSRRSLAKAGGPAYAPWHEP